MDRENAVEEGAFFRGGGSFSSRWMRKIPAIGEGLGLWRGRGMLCWGGQVCRGLARCRAFACLKLLAVLGGREARLLLDELAEEGKAREALLEGNLLSCLA